MVATSRTGKYKSEEDTSKPQKRRVAQTALHRPLRAPGAPGPQFLADQPGGGEADAADGQGGGEDVDAGHQLPEPQPRRADAPRQPDLPDHAHAAHHHCRRRQHRRVPRQLSPQAQTNRLPDQTRTRVCRAGGQLFLN